MAVSHLSERELSQLAADAVQASPTLDETQARVAVALYRLLAEGDPVVPARLADEVELPEEEVTATLAAWPAVYYDEQGRVVGFWGLALDEMPHRLVVDGRTLYGWCAFDTLFLPRILGVFALVESTAPVTGEGISLVIGPDAVGRVSPPSVALSFVRPTDATFDDNVISNFCHHILFFPSEEAGRRWANERSDIVILTVEQGVELARLWVKGLFGAAAVA